LQSDEAKKLALVEAVHQRFPRHPAVSWAYEQLQLALWKQAQWEEPGLARGGATQSRRLGGGATHIKAAEIQGRSHDG